MNAILESHITAALGRGRAPIDGGGTRNQIQPPNDLSAWQKDYGVRSEQEQKAVLAAARLHDDRSGDSDGLGGSKRKGRMDNGYRRFGSALWNEMISALCPGTRNIFIAAGILAFIAVI